MDIKPSEKFRVYINGQEVFVYQCEVASYALFSASNNLEIEIEILFSYEKVKIRPLTKEIQYEIKDNIMKIKSDNPQKLSLEFDDDITNPLFLLINPPVTNKPDPADPGVHYFASGKTYDIGLMELQEDETVYIEERAVVRGAFTAHQADNITIKGRGIIDGSKWHNRDDSERPKMFTPVRCSNVTVEGVTWINGPSWHVVPIACENVLIENINIISVVMTGDGIDVVGSEDVKINNCFMRTNDDCIALKAVSYDDQAGCKNVRDVKVTNCVLWNASCGNALEIGYETRAEVIENIIFEDCDIIRCEYEGHQSGGTFTIHNGDRALIKNVLYRNIRVEDSREKLIDIKILFSKYSNDETRGQVQDIKFQDIKIIDGKLPVSIIRGYNEEHMINDVIIEDLFYKGEKITNANQAKMVVELANNINFV